MAVDHSTDIAADAQVPVVVARALTDVLLDCLPAVLFGRRDLFSWLRPGGTRPSHADTIHVSVISDNGGHLADAEFRTTAAGFAAALSFLSAHGHQAIVLSTTYRKMPRPEPCSWPRSAMTGRIPRCRSRRRYLSWS